LKYTEERKKRILYNYLTSIFIISDKEYQKRVWIRGEGAEVDEYDETVCHFFDDGDPILEAYKDYHITEEQYILLKKFRDEFEVFDDSDVAEDSLPELFIDTPEWETVMNSAKEVLKAFNYKKS
jgi:hypothetical protein